MIEPRDIRAMPSARRKGIEECFVLAEDHRIVAQSASSGTLKVDWIFGFAYAAYNPVRMCKLMAVTVPAQ